MNVKKMILPRSGFQSSVNLGYDLARADKVRDFVPTEATMQVIEELVLATAPHATERAHILVGAYGKGKSHAVLVLLSLLAKRHREALAPTLAALECYRPELGQYLRTQVLAENAAPMLLVIVDGTQKHLASSFLLALKRTLAAAHLSALLPETPYQAAVRQIHRWQKEFPATYQALAARLDVPMETFLARLAAFDGASYQAFLAAYPALTAGSMFEPYADADVVELYAKAAKAVTAHGYRGLYVVYDEFGKYLEAQMETAGVSETRLLQDFAERASRSGVAQLHLLLITHKDITNYLGRLAKSKIDGWRGVSERFVHVEMQESFAEAYELIGRVIEKDEKAFQAFSRAHAAEFSALATRTAALHILADARDEAAAVRDCYPLHPLTVYLLPRLADLVAQNERTLFTFLARDSRDTLSDFLRQMETGGESFPLLRPDMVFDYFEPLFRQEAYTSLVGAAYRRVMQALALTKDALPQKLLKTVALLEMVAQGADVLPTAEVLAFAYDGTVSAKQVLTAIHALTEKLYVLHERAGSGVLAIKESSGVDVQQRCRDVAEKLHAEQPLVTVLNRLVSDVYLYPAKYNDDFEMTRYFAFRFVTAESFLAQTDWESVVTETGADGLVCALLPTSEEARERLENQLAGRLPQSERCLFLLPKRCPSIKTAAYEYFATEQLEKSEEDRVLRDEYALVRTDSKAVLTSFLRDMLEPERGGVTYFHAGVRQKIHRRAQLSRVLSEICETVFSKTPIINNETLNRDTLTAASLRTRERVVEALLAPKLSPDLGQKGVSQGMAFVRSALLHTGVLVQDDAGVHVHRDGLSDEKIEQVMVIIDDFFAHAAGTEDSSFAALYEKLRRPQHHIAMKKGPIPILLAAALRPYREYLTITGREGREMELRADLFRAIEAHPEAYRAQREDWSEEKEAYVKALRTLFALAARPQHATGESFSALAKTMQHWFLSLPNYARQTSDVSTETKKFRKSLQTPYLNARNYLFEKLPKLLSSETLPVVVTQVGVAKQELDMAKERLLGRLERALVELFGEDVQAETSLGSALADWRESLTDDVRQHVFSGMAQAMLDIVLAPPTVDQETIEALARAVLGLRIDDWDDAKEALFLSRMREAQQEIDAYATERSQHALSDDATRDGAQSLPQEDYFLAYIDVDGRKQQKAFDRVATSPRAKLLRNEIDDALETMGGALSREEKRQVLIEALQALL